MADGLWRSYLTALCNTGSIPSSEFTLVFVFLSPRPSPLLSSSFLLTSPTRSRSVQPGPTPVLPFPSSIFFAGSPPSVPRPPRSHVVVDGSLCDWLFLRLLKGMLERDWWVGVGSGHAGWASMWRQENIWFIRPVGQGGKRVTPARRHKCVTFQIQSTSCSSN